MSRRNAAVGLSVLALICAALIGAAVGLGGFTFVYAEGATYLTNDPNACANCHVMQKHVDAWTKSSHGKFATCNDCHAPHDLAGKYYCKARNGFFHSLAFTTGDFPENIRMHEYNRGVTEHACVGCHADVTHSIQVTATGSGELEATSCIRCHSTVGHDT